MVVKLKGDKWANGETVSAQDVMFWMNMLHADKTSWAAYTPSFIPDNVKDVKVDNANQLTFTLSTPVNPRWFTSDQLSQITPLSSGVGHQHHRGRRPAPAAASTAAFGTSRTSSPQAVYAFLSKQAGGDPEQPQGEQQLRLATYATSPIVARLSTVHGSCRSRSTPSGNVSFVPEPDTTRADRSRH